MVEVLTTGIKSEQQEEFMLVVLRIKFPEYRVNFDLEDCDNILRMQTKNGALNATPVIDLVNNHGFEIEVLPEIPVAKTAFAR